MSGKRALYLPGPSYHDEGVKKYAGWHRILELQREAIQEAGYSVDTPNLNPALIDGSSSFSKIASWSLVATSFLQDRPDLIVGAPSYGHHCFMASERASKRVAYVWNNADWYRDKMLQPAYQAARVPYPTHPINQFMNRSALDHADRIIACSPFVAKTHAQIEGIPEISIANWGVDSELFQPGEKDDYFTIVFVGGDPVRKGVRYLMEALTKITRRPVGGGRVNVWIVGCELTDNWIPIAVRDIDDRIRFYAWGMRPHAEMPDLLRRAHVLVLPSLEDGIALCVQEAMASGVVPIATDDPAEVFEDGVSGFKIPYRDSEAIAARLEELMQDPLRYREMAQEARAHAETRTWEKFKAEFTQCILGVPGE